jgi:predicted RNase H-like nuclease (RuvC/YqgF family)
MSRSSQSFPHSARYEALGRIEEEKSPRLTNSSSSEGGEQSVETRQDNPVSAESVAIQEFVTHNEELRRKCEELEALMARLRNDGNVFKMKTSMTLSTFRSKIASLTKDKEALSGECARLEEEIDGLRDQNWSRQLEILALESIMNKEKEEERDADNAAALQDTNVSRGGRHL